MYRKVRPAKSSIKVNNTYVGETIEEKVARIMNNKEPIKDAMQPIYTERKDGVLPGTNIRTDRFELALEGTDAIAKTLMAKREGFINELDKQNAGKGEAGKGEPGKGDANKPGGGAGETGGQSTQAT